MDSTATAPAILKQTMSKIVSEFNPCGHANMERLLTEAVINDYWNHMIIELSKRPDIITKEELAILTSRRRLLTQFKVENESYISSKKLKN